tara:strand:- start:2585 stop:3244 length:660 start_codon:yes stop_codon:yes gene_type:complete
MKVLSINISEPKKITFNGKELITSIYKMPINKEVEVGQLGIEGDRQADLQVHGGYDKAVYAYSHSHYSHWSEIMKKSYEEFGLVGENLTIDNFDESAVFIGDEYKIGTTLLQISQPRIPCYKIGIKMNSREFPKLFSQSGLLGSYMRVIEVGKMKIGDSVELSRRDNDSMSIFEISQLLFVDIKNIESMKKAIDLKYLSEEIKERFRERLMKLGDFSSL